MSRLENIGPEFPNEYVPLGVKQIVRDTMTGQHYLLSQLAGPHAYETLAFRCDAGGEVEKWNEVAGRMHGHQTIEEVREELEDSLSANNKELTP